jgi:hypothetical protein
MTRVRQGQSRPVCRGMVTIRPSQGKALQMEASVFWSAFPSFCVAGASRSYASHFVKDAAACSVPEITASEHCSVCSAPARTMSKGRLYLRLLME